MKVKSKNDTNEVLSLFARLDKDAKGSMTTILIIAIIHRSKSSWGYHIKKEIQQLTKSDEPIKDSSLYTILNSLEKQYGILESYSEDRRKYFKLSSLGKDLLDDIYAYWNDYLLLNIEILGKLGMPVNSLIGGT